MVHLDPSCLVEVQTPELVAAADFSFCLVILESTIDKMVRYILKTYKLTFTWA